MQLFVTFKETSSKVSHDFEFFGRGMIHDYENRHIVDSSLPVSNTQIILLANKVNYEYKASYGGCYGTIAEK